MFKRSVLISLLLSGHIMADQVDHLESGRKRIVDIMSNDETGIASYNKKNIGYAETRNLDNDLNVSQIAKFFDCKTLIGQSFITETLRCPVNPEDRNAIIIKRQSIIKLLVENPKLKREIDLLLETAKEEEKFVVELLSDFFKGKTCPELNELELLRKQNNPFTPMMEFFYLNPTGRIVDTSLGLIGLPLTAYTIKKLGYATYLQAKAGQNFLRFGLLTAYMTLAFGLTSRKLYKDYSFAIEKRRKIHSLNSLINIAENIEHLSNTNNLDVQFKISNIKNIKGIQLLQKIKHSRYQSKESYLFVTPSVHSFLYELYQEEKNLAEIFACIAEMDAYNAIAGKIINSQNEKNKFCFVNFIEDTKPVVKANAFWNVLVKDAVSSSMAETKHIILTGPNAGGKTTAIRAILQNIVLGQTFGVAAAQSFDFTMFDMVHSYLNVSDDLINGLSLFASEVKRAQEVLQKIKSLDNKKKFFFALDELFTGTVSEDGETCAYEFVKKISQYQGVQFVYATHFKRLKELGKDNEYCINYKVDAPTKNVEGKLVYPFTLSQGANEVNVAIDMAKEANLFA